MASLLFRSLVVGLSLVTVASFAHAQTNQIADKPTLEILNFKIGNNYYPLLDRQPSAFSAEAVEVPQTEAEKLARRTAQANRQNSTYNQSTPRGVIAPEDKSSRGRLRSTIRVIDMAEWVNVSVKNLSDKPIRAITWDFAFPRYEDGKLVLRYEVSSKADIKPGGKKTLKQPLPPGAMKCKVVTISDGKAFESVCSKSFQDPSQFHQDAVSIKKIEYADGSVWSR
ncbi:MAG TPA: hypothetical protein VFZ34_30390 [Blastocatellia bacterium]|nr:hypothetical protein [Blastocatellia bacterium]